MNFLLESILTLKYRLLVSALLGLLSGILNGTIVFLINHPHKYYFSFSSKNLFFIAIVSSCILMVVSQSWLIKLSQSVIYKLCKSICERVLSAKLSNFEQLGKAKIYAVLSRDLNMLSSALLVFPQLLINFSIVFFCSVYVGFFSLQVLLQVFILLLISIIFFYIFDLFFVKKKFEKVREHTDDLYKSYQGMLEGFKELKLNNPKSKAFQENYLFRAAKAIEKTNGSALFRYTLAQSLWDNLFYFFIGILAFLELYSHKSSIITIKIIIILLFMAAPLKVIILILPQIRQYIVSIQKIASLNIKPEVGKRFKTDSSLLLDKITFNKIGYKYDNFEIGPIDLTLVPGQITYITGKNGSGKSTLAKLIAGLYTPTQGKIFINGCLLTENWLFQYRHNVSAIFTDFYLFDEIPIDLTSSQAREFLSLLGLENKLNLQSNYVNSSVLSTGQRKRLALLYAYLENKKIIILDEWASDQDQQYKEVFYCSIIPRLKKLGKIIVVITHDDRFFHMADQLINLH